MNYEAFASPGNGFHALHTQRKASGNMMTLKKSQSIDRGSYNNLKRKLQEKDI
jgi:hypothetical protein